MQPYEGYAFESKSVSKSQLCRNFAFSVLCRNLQALCFLEHRGLRPIHRFSNFLNVNKKKLSFLWFCASQTDSSKIEGCVQFSTGEERKWTAQIVI